MRVLMVHSDYSLPNTSGNYEKGPYGTINRAEDLSAIIPLWEAQRGLWQSARMTSAP